MRGFFCEPRKPFFSNPKEKDFSWYFWVEIIIHKKARGSCFFNFLWGVFFWRELTDYKSGRSGTFLTSSTSAKFKTLPKFSLPKFSLPKFFLPKFSLPKFFLPKFSFPKFSLLKFSLPKFSLLKFSLLKLNFHNSLVTKFKIINVFKV